MPMSQRERSLWMLLLLGLTFAFWWTSSWWLWAAMCLVALLLVLARIKEHRD